MKKFLFSFILFCVIAPIQAAVFDFTYANGEISDYGKGTKETLDVAMRLDYPDFKGMNLKGVRAYIATDKGMKDISVWVTKELTLDDNKVNKPDIVSIPVSETSSVTFGDKQYCCIHVELPEAYELTGEPVYIGYSLMVEESASPEQKRPIIITEDNDPNGFFFHASKSVKSWSDYVDKAGGVAYIVAEIEGNKDPYVLDVYSYETIFAESGKGFNVDFTTQNTGVETVESISYKYSFDNSGNSFENTVTLDSPLTPSLTNFYPVSLSFEGVEGAGPHVMKVELTALNGEPNSEENATIECTVNVIPFTPVHRPLVEEYTGLWCGWCPRGFLAMEMLGEDNPDTAVIACYHFGDVMAVTDDTPVYVKGLPGSSIDREGNIDPYYGSSGEGGIEFGIDLDFDRIRDEFTYADIHVEASLEGDEVKVESNYSFVLDLKDADYEVGYLLIANGLTSLEYAQSNFYAGSKAYNGTPLEVLTTWDDVVFGLVFNDVVVNSEAYLGVKGSIPAEIIHAQSYSHQYSFDIAKNALIQDRNALVVAAFVIDKETGRIVNANKCKVTTAGVESIFTETGEDIIYNLQGQRVTNPTKGLYIINGKKVLLP